MDRDSILMNIMLLGAGGQLGYELAEQLAKVGCLSSFTSRSLDITNHTKVKETIDNLRPDIIINAAAYTAVDKAEEDSETAFSVNSAAVNNLARSVQSIGAWLIHYSTDYVFDGTQASPYVETDTPCPINIYGQSKLQGEQALATSGCKHLIFRTSWVIGRHGHNFAKTILNLAQNRSSLRIISDQIGVPTSTQLISLVTSAAVEAISSHRSWPAGTYHLTPTGSSSWYEVAQLLLKIAAEEKVNLEATESSIKAINTMDYPTAAQRPLNSLLNTDKLSSQLPFKLPDWHEDFSSVAKSIIQELVSG